MEEVNFNHLKRLWNLKLVVETGSIKRAATRVNVTSSAMSQSISGLEQALGRKLLLRKKGHLSPTEFCHELLRSAGPAFEVFSDLQKRISGQSEVVPKLIWLDFAAAESLAVDILPGIMARLRKRFPEIRLKVKSGRSSVLTKLVRKAELCMAVVEENEFMDGVSCIPLCEDRLGFFFSSKMVAHHKKENLFSALGVGMLTAGPDGHPRYLRKFIHGLGKAFKPTLTSESYEILRACAVEGSVISILPTRVAHRRRSELTEVFPESNDSSKGRYQIYLVSEPRCTPEENIFLAEQLKSLISGIGP